MEANTEISRVTIVGTGLIGGSWGMVFDQIPVCGSTSKATLAFSEEPVGWS